MKVASFIFCLAVLLSPTLSLAETQYFHGEIMYVSPDGTTSFGNTHSLVKREILESEAKIIETVVQPGLAPQSDYEEYTIELSLTEAAGVFNVIDNTNVLSGTISFEGDEWHWDRWTYDLRMVTGEIIRGTGETTESGIRSKKQFFRQDILIMNISEDLKSISEREYRVKHGQLAPLRKGKPRS